MPPIKKEASDESDIQENLEVMFYALYTPVLKHFFSDVPIDGILDRQFEDIVIAEYRKEKPQLNHKEEVYLATQARMFLCRYDIIGYMLNCLFDKFVAIMQRHEIDERIPFFTFAVSQSFAFIAYRNEGMVNFIDTLKRFLEHLLRMRHLYEKSKTTKTADKDMNYDDFKIGKNAYFVLKDILANEDHVESNIKALSGMIRSAQEQLKTCARKSVKRKLTYDDPKDPNELKQEINYANALIGIYKKYKGYKIHLSSAKTRDQDSPSPRRRNSI